MKFLLLGNPKLPTTVTEHWGWCDIPQAEQEASMVAELLQTEALTGAHASKQAVLARIQDAECVHLATHVAWKLSSLVLSPVEVRIRFLYKTINKNNAFSIVGSGTGSTKTLFHIGRTRRRRRKRSIDQRRTSAFIGIFIKRRRSPIFAFISETRRGNYNNNYFNNV